ncbi:MAG: hypothetical protein LBF58_06190 [Deltaproteobacteria bacterium]|jgi:hypothetical protein|nr:hypothetical protein [Deltaproteobacteria bacterium]
MCERTTTHKILSVQGGQPRQVACMTCDYRHVYKPGEPEPEPVDPWLEAGIGVGDQEVAEDKESPPKASAKPAAKAKAPAKKAAPKAEKPKTARADPESVEWDLEDFPDPAEAPKAPAVKAPAKAAKAEPKVSTKEAKEAREAKEAKRAANEEIELHREKWNDLKNRLGTNLVINYTINGDYPVDQAIKHSKFGLGFVTKIFLPNKIEVQFEDSAKVLVMRVPPLASNA